MDSVQIMKILPHRYPFLLLDRMEEVVPGQKAVGIKNVTINEEFFQGHFPGNPVMPGVLILEFLAQVAGVLAYTSVGEHNNNEQGFNGRLFYFMSMDKVKFRRPVIPGDQLRGEVFWNKFRGSIASFRGKAYVGDTLVAEAEMKAVLVDQETATKKAAERK